MTTPDFDELFGPEVSGAERDQLRRAHEALVAAGAPPELPSRLAEPPAKTWEPEVTILPRGIPRRRLAASLVLAAAIAAASFGAGYIVRGDGADGSSQTDGVGSDSAQVVTLRGAGAPDGVVIVRFGRPDAEGNTEMLITAEGLEPLSGGDYYVLDMIKGGKRLVRCGTFNVGGKNDRTTIRLSVGYDVTGFDALALVLYRAENHSERVLIRAPLPRV